MPNLKQNIINQNQKDLNIKTLKKNHIGSFFYLLLINICELNFSISTSNVDKDTLGPVIILWTLFSKLLQNESENTVIESLRLNHSLTYVNFKSNRVPIRIMKEINTRIQINKLIEKEKFLPQLKREIRDLSFDPEEINLLKQRIILQSQEKEMAIQN